MAAQSQHSREVDIRDQVSGKNMTLVEATPRLPDEEAVIFLVRVLPSSLVIFTVATYNLISTMSNLILTSFSHI
jgi:hypothetical protein